jgi:hypothetical protein
MYLYVCIYIYIYTDTYMCVCVCVCFDFKRLLFNFVIWLTQRGWRASNLYLILPNVNLPVSPPSISLIWFRAMIIGNNHFNKISSIINKGLSLVRIGYCTRLIDFTPFHSVFKAHYYINLWRRLLVPAISSPFALNAVWNTHLSRVILIYAFDKLRQYFVKITNY